MTPDPTIDAFRDVLGESLDEIRSGIAGLTVEQLNAAPAGGDTNSIAVIVTHALSATLSWLSLAMGAPLPQRDRDAEFRTVADAGFAATSAEVSMEPTTKVELTEEKEARQVLGFVERLEELEDVQNVYANFDLPDALLEQLEATIAG